MNRRDVLSIIDRRTVFDRSSLRSHKDGTYTVYKINYLTSRDKATMLNQTGLERNLVDAFGDSIVVLNNSRENKVSKNKVPYERVTIRFKLSESNT